MSRWRPIRRRNVRLPLQPVKELTAMTTATQSDAVAFFREHAGFSYDAKRETAEQGRERCARDLATAEAAYRADSDVFVVWQVDETVDSSFFDSETEPHALYCALLCSEVDRTDSHGIEHPRSGEILVWDPETF